MNRLNERSRNYEINYQQRLFNKSKNVYTGDVDRRRRLDPKELERLLRTKDWHRRRRVAQTNQRESRDFTFWSLDFMAKPRAAEMRLISENQQYAQWTHREEITKKEPTMWMLLHPRLGINNNIQQQQPWQRELNSICLRSTPVQVITCTFCIQFTQ